MGRIGAEHATLHDFVAESNRIEGMHHVRSVEMEAHERLLALPTITVADVQAFVDAIGGGPLRDVLGMDVRVGQHYPPPGGPTIRQQLTTLLYWAMPLSPDSPYAWHTAFETLHPFMDGNGRSGRALWLRMMGGIDRVPLGFLHTWYYQSLQESRP